MTNNPEAPTREDVVDAWRKVSALGYDDPTRIDAEPGQPLADELTVANELHISWLDREAITPEVLSAFTELWIHRNDLLKPRFAPDGLEAAWRLDFESATVFVDAGFTAPDYLGALESRLALQEEAAKNQYFTELADAIAAKRAEINQQLGKVGISSTD